MPMYTLKRQANYLERLVSAKIEQTVVFGHKRRPSLAYNSDLCLSLVALIDKIENSCNCKGLND